MELGERSYAVSIGRGILSQVKDIFNLKRKVFIVTDSGVPKEYARTVADAAEDAIIVTVPEGEGSKCLSVYGELLTKMVEFGMTRTDCAVAVGGGVVGDLTGFAAASYMRGIDFYNIPTTLLSQVDSSIGGKTAIDHAGVKNIVGAFHQPKGVLVDTDTLKTLPKRQISNGLAEAVKMALTSDGELFKLFEEFEPDDGTIDEIIKRALEIKKRVVEQDEKESGLRRILNFGHTLGHGVEANEGLDGLYHGECVAIGMLVTTSEPLLGRLMRVLERLGLPTGYNGDLEGAISFISHDKKCDGKALSAVFVDTPGSFRIEKISVEAFADLTRKRLIR